MHPSSDLTFALRIAEAASKEILDRFPPESVERKSDGSEVTAADREAEKAMRSLIEAEHPDHGVLGEEGADVDCDGRYRWVLDPIDGTAWFALGIPKFGTLVGLLDDNRPVLGVIHLPVTGETVFAERGSGCWYRRGSSQAHRVRVDRGVRSLSDAYVSSAGLMDSAGNPEYDIDRTRQLEVLDRARQVRFVGDCLQHALVARGMLHAALDPLMYPWDVAALVPCILEAGGVATTLSGDTENLIFGKSLVTSCHPALHDEILSVLHQAA